MIQAKNATDTSSQSSSSSNLFASTNGNTYANTDDLLGSFNGLDFSNSNNSNNNNNAAMMQPIAPNTASNNNINKMPIPIHC